MAAARQLLQVALLSVVAVRALAASKKLVAHIQCAVCKQAVKEASLHAKEKHIDSDEEALLNSVENVCSATKDEGKWTLKMDIIRKQGGQLGLDRRDEPGVCKNECKVVQKACSMWLKNSEESLVSLIGEGAGIGRLQREVCSKPCKKSLPELGEWQDEVFQPAQSAPPAPTPPPKTDLGDRIRKKAILVASINDTIEALSSELNLKIDDVRACYKGSDAAAWVSQFAKEVDLSIEDLILKQITKMRSGLGKLGRTVAALARTVAHLCKDSAVAAKKMEALGAKLAESEVDASTVEYKPMELLKVNGIDIHKELNKFIVAWKEEDDKSLGAALGKTLGKLLKKFESDTQSSSLKAEL